MKTLVKVKTTLKNLYGRYDFIIDTVIRFIVAWAAMKLMADRLGFFDLLCNRFILTIVALVCSILPWGLSAVVLGICLVLHMYGAGIEAAVIAAFVLITVGLLYYGFQPGHAELIILTPLFFAFKIPYAIVLMAGLTSGLLAVVPVGVGVLIYYLAAFAKNNNIQGIEGAELMEIPGRMVKLIDAMLVNKQMWGMIILLVATLLVVYFLHNMSFDYSRYVALGVGTLVLIAGRILGLDVNIIFVIISLAIAAAVNFIIFTVDYKNSQRLEFTDDDYVYYVKAVPKKKE